MKYLFSTILFIASISFCKADPWVVYDGGEGPGKGKHVVLISGDEEYRSEEALPMLGRILAEKHGFKCTVLFAVNPETGEVDPTEQTNIPNLEVLDTADFAIIALRFRELPDADMKHFVDYVSEGNPLLGLRTSTHAFNYTRNKQSPYAGWSFDSESGGFGREILGETWISHHGEHKAQAQRGVIEDENKSHPLLTGVADVFGPSDVYGVTTLPEDAVVLMRGEVLDGMTADAPAADDGLNDPMMPIAWFRERQIDGAEPQKIITTTMGAAEDFEHPGLRRFVVNSVYWGVGLEVPQDMDVLPVKPFWPTRFGFDDYKTGREPQYYQDR